MLTLADGCINSRSSLQKYVAVTKSAQETIWLDIFFIKMGLKQQIDNFQCDNLSVLHLVANQLMDNY